MSILDLVRKKLGRQEDDRGLPESLLSAFERLRNIDSIKDTEIKRYRAALNNPKVKLSDLQKSTVNYQIFLVDKTCDMLKGEVAYRLEYIRSLDTDKKREDELIKCASGVEGTKHWINTWAWIHEGRTLQDYATSFPFKLLNKQVEFIEWLEELVFLYKYTGLAEKCRDMGLSWAYLAFCLKHLIFKPRFECLVASRNEGLVDKSGHIDTLIEKCRFMMRMLPKWMLPPDYDLGKDMPFLAINNPHTLGFIQGESSNDDLGRQGRYNLIVIDEFAAYPGGGYSAFGACSQSAPAKLVVSTPKGLYNKFAELRNDGSTSVFTFRWQDHEFKNQDWYDRECAALSDTQIEQELNIGYEGSAGELVLKEWKPLYHVITWSEFARFYGERAYDYNGKPRIPSDWLMCSAQDRGYSTDHRCVTTWAARPSYGYELTDSIFLFREFMADLRLSPNEIAEKIIELESHYHEERRITERYLSHEGTGEQLVYEDHGLYYEKADTDFNLGVAQMKAYMALIDKDKPHPFRSWLPDMQGNCLLMGRPRWFVVVADRAMPQYDKASNEWKLPLCKDNEGDIFGRGRNEAPMYHFPESERGKAAKAQRPLKDFDDALDTWRYIAVHLPVIAVDARKQLADAVNAALPENLQRHNAPTDPDELGRFIMTRQFVEADQRALIQEQNAPIHWRDRLWGRSGASPNLNPRPAQKRRRR